MGFYRHSSAALPQGPFAESFNGASWRVLPTPAPGPLGSGLYHVSCGATARCMAVGGFLTTGPGGPRAFAEAWNGSVWALLTVPTHSPAFSDLYGVSCVTASACMAAGERFPQLTLADRWNGTSWQVVPTRNP